MSRVSSKKADVISEEEAQPAPVDAAPTSNGFPPTQEDIRRRAYELYLERGGGSGDEVEDWIRAERELSGGIGTAASVRAASGRKKRSLSA